MWHFLRSAIFVLPNYIQFEIRVWNRSVVLINKFDKLELASKHIWSTNTESTSFWRIVLVRDFCVASDTWNRKHLHHLQRVCDKRASFVGRIVYFEHYANLKLIRLTLCCFYGWLVFLCTDSSRRSNSWIFFSNDNLSRVRRNGNLSILNDNKRQANVFEWKATNCWVCSTVC